MDFQGKRVLARLDNPEKAYVDLLNEKSLEKLAYYRAYISRRVENRRKKYSDKKEKLVDDFAKLGWLFLATATTYDVFKFAGEKDDVEGFSKVLME